MDVGHSGESAATDWSAGLTGLSSAAIDLRLLLDELALEGVDAPIKADLGHRLKQLGYNDRERAEAFSLASAPTTGFAIVNSTGYDLTLSLRPDAPRLALPPPRPPPAAAAALAAPHAAVGDVDDDECVDKLRRVMHRLAACGEHSPLKSTVGQHLSQAGFDAARRQEAYTYALRAGILKAAGSGADITLTLATTSKATSSSGLQPPLSASDLSHRHSDCVEALRALLKQSGLAPPRKSMIGSLLATRGFTATERSAAFAFAEGPHGFAATEGQGGFITIALKSPTAGRLKTPTVAGGWAF